MKYKNYDASITYDDEARVFRGRVLGVRDVINFYGTNPDELETAFHDSIDDYLAFCEEQHRQPEKSFSGKILLRLPPETHRMIARAAETSHVSINQWIERTLASHAQHG